VGLDTCSPVIDDYEAKMPFRFAGTIQKVQIKLGENKLTPKETSELERRRTGQALSTQ
jgi:hypothetical protein